MSQRILDEREHRRGLVLGLTLAEVLVLLLFLLLLALGHRLNQLQKEAAAAAQVRDVISAELEGVKAELAQFKSTLPKDLTAEEMRAILVDLPSLKAQVEKLEASLQEVQPALKIAKSIDPKSPVLLKRAMEILTPDQKNALIQEMRGQRSRIETGSIAKDGHNWPPIITLSEASGYFFASGSAEVSSDFQAKLSTKVVADLLEIIKKYNVDIVEIVGHTDEQKLVVRPSNLDTVLIPFLKGDPDLDRFLPSDNAGLGLARAAAVLRVLSADIRLQSVGVKLLPLSGGQVIEVGDVLSTGKSPGNVKERRRIEIRARRSDKSAS